MITRRQLLDYAVSVGSYMALPRTSEALARFASLEPLDAMAASRGWYIGIAVDTASLLSPELTHIVCENFNLATVSGMKWNRIHPTPETFDFAEADRGVDFALTNRLQVHGHNLCWNSPEAYPAWFSPILTRSNAERYLTTHIRTLASRYRGHIDSWDVVNEPITSWSKRSDLLYPGIWLDLLGPEYIDIAFHAVANADPHARRVLNIYDVEQDSPNSTQTRQSTLALLRRLIAEAVPVQAIGLESHLDVTRPLGGAASFRF